MPEGRARRAPCGRRRADDRGICFVGAQGRGPLAPRGLPGGLRRDVIGPSRGAAGKYDVAVFAGGEGTRIGGGKAGVLLAGRPLISWVVAAVAHGAQRVGVVARDAAAAEAAAQLAGGAEPWIDAPGIFGPVAALLGAARAASAPLLLTVPVDTPFLPHDLAATLAAALAGAEGFAAIACDEIPATRLHPTIALYRRAPLATLPPQKSLRATIAPLVPVAVPFAQRCLMNVNTRADLAAAEALAGTAPLTPVSGSG